MSKTTIHYELRRHRSFSLETATEHVWYALYEQHKTLFGRIKWRPVKGYYYTGDTGAFEHPVRGDKNWAKAIAKELNIKMPRG